VRLLEVFDQEKPCSVQYDNSSLGVFILRANIDNEVVCYTTCTTRKILLH